MCFKKEKRQAKKNPSNTLVPIEINKLLEEAIFWLMRQSCPRAGQVSASQPHLSNWRTQVAGGKSAWWCEILQRTSTGHSWESSQTCKHTAASVRNVKATDPRKGLAPRKAHLSAGSTSPPLRELCSVSCAFWQSACADFLLPRFHRDLD